MNVLGLYWRAARAAGWNDEQIDAFRREATSGNYDHLLATAMEHFEVE